MHLMSNAMTLVSDVGCDDMVLRLPKGLNVDISKPHNKNQHLRAKAQSNSTLPRAIWPSLECYPVVLRALTFRPRMPLVVLMFWCRRSTLYSPVKRNL